MPLPDVKCDFMCDNCTDKLTEFLPYYYTHLRLPLADYDKVDVDEDDNDITTTTNNNNDNNNNNIQSTTTETTTKTTESSTENSKEVSAENKTQGTTTETKKRKIENPVLPINCNNDLCKLVLLKQDNNVNAIIPILNSFWLKGT